MIRACCRRYTSAQLSFFLITHHMDQRWSRSPHQHHLSKDLPSQHHSTQSSYCQTYPNLLHPLPLAHRVCTLEMTKWSIHRAIHHSHLSSHRPSSGNTFQSRRLECDGKERSSERMMEEEEEGLNESERQQELGVGGSWENELERNWLGGDRRDGWRQGMRKWIDKGLIYTQSNDQWTKNKHELAH